MVIISGVPMIAIQNPGGICCESGSCFLFLLRGAKRSIQQEKVCFAKCNVASDEAWATVIVNARA